MCRIYLRLGLDRVSETVRSVLAEYIGVTPTHEQKETDTRLHLPDAIMDIKLLGSFRTHAALERFTE